MGLDLPEKPQTPPQTQKELEDLKVYSQTQNLRGIRHMNEPNRILDLDLSDDDDSLINSSSSSSAIITP